VAPGRNTLRVSAIALSAWRREKQNPCRRRFNHGSNSYKERKEREKEKKFNSERIARQVKNSLRAVFPKDNFIVSSFVERVEILYFDNTASLAELNMFTVLFCHFANVKKEQLLFAKIKKDPIATAK